ncbi:MAG: DNA helicase [Proteobacteria bacterium]|nr:MAG: DNA helicase [Pseudomonadota bacterium]
MSRSFPVSSSHLDTPNDAASAVGEPHVTPCVRLFCETLRIDVGHLGMLQWDEVKAPALALSFDYAGARRVAASDDDTVVCIRGGEVLRRDRQAESHARYVLESLGALDVACAEHLELPARSPADYVARVEDDVHGKCSFSAYALPQLRALGWQVVVDADYPWQVVNEGGASPWYASLEPDESADWFDFELGVEVDGERMNLLPALLEMLEGAGSLEAALRRRRLVAVQARDNRFVTLSPKRLRPLIEVLLELYSGDTLRAGGGGARIPALGIHDLSRLDEAFTSGDLDDEADETFGAELEQAQGGVGRRQRRLRWCGSGAEELTRAQALLARPQTSGSPRGLRATLRPYQQEGLDWLQHLRRVGVGGILADDMGLGKTLQTIAHLLREHGPERPADSEGAKYPSVVIAPTSLVTNWMRELARFAPDLWAVAYHGAKRDKTRPLLPHVDVVITTYPIVQRDLELLQRQSFHLLILDEAQTIKNATSQIHRAVKLLRAEVRVCLSGTPLENHLGELWSLFDFLMPRFLGDKASFTERYRRPIEQQGDEERMEMLRQRVAPLILRRTKEQVATELPEKTEIVRAVELDGDQRELYESIRIAAHAQVRRAIAERGLARSQVAILGALMKLRQVCCDPRLVKMEAAREVQESAKYDLFFELLEGQLAQRRRVLVFSQFTSMLALLSEGLAEREVQHSCLTGSTHDRQVPIESFTKGLVDVLLISLKAGGTGLNLTRADTVIHYDPWWNPAAQAQATDRAYRIGQTRQVFAYNLIIAGSVEERMLQLQQRKRALADGLLGGGSLAEISERELDDLFGPLR